MYALAQDFRFALRQLWKVPGLAVTVVLTLALGIGATTAIFSLVEGVLLRPLPFSDPGRLVVLGDHLRDGLNTPVTAREISTYSKTTQACSSMGAYIGVNYVLSSGATPEEVSGARVTTSLFPTLGIRPIIGRTFTQEEEDAHAPITVISYSLWMNRYDRDAHVLSQSIDLNGKSYSIIGVMPRSFEFPLQPGHLDQSQFWVPMSLTADELSDDNTGFWGYHIVARLKDGVTLPQAAKDADRVAQQVMRSFPAKMSAIHIKGDVTLLRESTVGEVRPWLRTLLFAVSVVLLIACVNVAGVLLVRAIRRRREYAVRLALGARSGIIIRESLFEGLLLSIAGGLLGLGFAAALIRASLHLLPESMPRIDSIFIDSTVAGFALLLAFASGALCSLAPAFAALRTNLTESLKEDARTGAGASSHAWLRSTLVVSEIAIALLLLTVSGAFLRSFQKMRAVNPGFSPEHVLVAHFRLPVSKTSAEPFNHEAVDRLAHQPGIVAAGITNMLPASGGSALAGYTVEGISADRWKLKFAAFAMAYGDYFRAMDIPLLEGRTFTEADNSEAPLVMIVNQSMAKDAWPGEEAVGKRLHVGNPKNPLPWATVIGVVADTKTGARDEPSIDQLYFPAQQPASLFGPKAGANLTGLRSGYIALRSALAPEQMIQTLRSTIAAIDPLLVLQQVQPMSDVISNIEAPRRFNTELVAAFGLCALLLAITGIYAVVAFAVSLRTPEIAIRMALGSQRIGIVRMVLFSAAKLGLLGCGLGVIASLAVSRLVRSFLFEVSATDPRIYTASVVVMIGMALLASAVPARRAASTNPVDALRAT